LNGPLKKQEDRSLSIVNPAVDLRHALLEISTQTSSWYKPEIDQALTEQGGHTEHQ